MPAQICFEMQGKRICVPLYYAYDPFWWIRDPGGPVERIRDRLRETIRADHIPSEARVNLSVLAALDELAEVSEGKLHTELSRIVDETVREIDEALPEGVEVEMAKAPAMA